MLEISEKWIESIFYKKGETLSFIQARDKAILFLDYIQTTKADLFDCWFGLADNWDMNIWVDDIWVDDGWINNEKNTKVFDKEIINITLYSVDENNETDYNNFYRIMTNGKLVEKGV